VELPALSSKFWLWVTCEKFGFSALRIRKLADFHDLMQQQQDNSLAHQRLYVFQVGGVEWACHERENDT